MELIKTIKTIYNIIYIYKKENKLVAFKPSKYIKKELLADKLAKFFNINTMNIKPVKIKGTAGIFMDYLKDSVLLMHYNKKLDNKQLNQLKKIIIFDIWIGNRDRHTANIFVNHDLTVFDHENVFNDVTARKCIKLDTGRRLNKDYVTIIEKSIDKHLTAKKILLKIGFKKTDFLAISENKIKNIIDDKKLIKFLISRSNFDNILF